MFRTTILTCALLGPVICLAQSSPAEQWFNKAAREYLKEDRITALRTLDAGLREHPGDPRMLKLAEELMKENQQDPKEQEQEQQEQEEQKEQEEQEKKEQDDKGKDGSEKKESEEKEKGSEGDEQEKRPEEQQQPKPGEQGEPDQPSDAQPRKDRIAPQDARRMLEALDRQERMTLEKARERERPANRSNTDKDW